MLFRSVVVLGTALSAIRTVVLPRAASTLIGRLLFPSVRKVFLLAAKARKDFEAKDRILALYAPTVLLLLPFVWATLITLGFALVYMGVLGVGFGEAFEVSGSSLLTLGFTKPGGLLEIIEPAELLSEMLGAHAVCHGGSLELVFLNGCRSHALGQAVKAAGVAHEIGRAHV